MNFGEAIEVIKAGGKVAREGWNGKNMHLYLEEGRTRLGRTHAEDVQFGPYIVMFTAQGIHQPGWLASQTDMLADDWVKV